MIATENVVAGSFGSNHKSRRPLLNCLAITQFTLLKGIAQMPVIALPWYAVIFIWEGSLATLSSLMCQSRTPFGPIWPSRPTLSSPVTPRKVPLIPVGVDDGPGVGDAEGGSTIVIEAFFAADSL